MSLPLAGLRVVVTRAEHQSAGLVHALAAAGADPEPLPLLAIEPPRDPAPLRDAATRLRDFAWVVLTSSNAVDALVAAAPPPWPSTLAVATVGAATTLALARHGVEATVVATTSQAEGVLDALLPRLAAGDRVLLPQAEDARPVLREGLRAAGARVEPVVAYRKATPHGAAVRAGALFPHGAPLGWVTFTSPSTARAFAALLGDDWPARRRTLRAASIGPVTSAALRELGVEPAVEASATSDGGLVEAIAAAVAPAATAGAADAS